MTSLANERVAYFNGEILPESRVLIPFRDRGYKFGDAAFDVARTFGGKVFKLEALGAATRSEGTSAFESPTPRHARTLLNPLIEKAVKLNNQVKSAMIYPIAAIRNIPLAGARWFAEIAVKSRKWALIYVLVLFYCVPAFFAFLNRYL